jgi:lipoprotein NlpI
VAEFRHALTINPQYVEARTNLALTLRTAGKLDQSKDEFKRVLELDPTNTVALSHLRE